MATIVDKRRSALAVGGERSCFEKSGNDSRKAEGARKRWAASDHDSQKKVAKIASKQKSE